MEYTTGVREYRKVNRWFRIGFIYRGDQLGGDVRFSTFVFQVTNCRSGPATGHSIFSAFYKFARNNKIKYIITGSNYLTECCREPQEWGGYSGVDKTLLMAIHKKF
jgi:hypothetical protein